MIWKDGGRPGDLDERIPETILVVHVILFLIEV